VGIPFAAVFSYEKSYAVAGPASRYVWAYFYTIFFLVEWDFVMPSAVLLGIVLFLLRLARRGRWLVDTLTDKNEL
jgi:hypothetical protein